MEDNQYQWHDPLLLTDVSWQEQRSSRESAIRGTSPNPSIPSCFAGDSVSSEESRMEDPVDPLDHNADEEVSELRNISDPIANDAVDGQTMFGFSSPDLVVCEGSPDVRDFHDCLKTGYSKNMRSSIELSMEKCINESEMGTSYGNSAEKLLSSQEKAFLEASFEVHPEPRSEEEEVENGLAFLSINVGSNEQPVTLSGIEFSEDVCFTGGDTIRTDAMIGNEEWLPLYQTARFGNFSYQFSSLEPGNYLVNLHFAEIINTNGPPGMRVFDVFIQEKKAVCSIDIYAKVGANSPLVVSDLEASVGSDGGLCIRFEGVTGTPIVCGICIRKGSPASFRADQSVEFRAMEQTEEPESTHVDSSRGSGGRAQVTHKECEFQERELAETKHALVELRREYELKSRECTEAWNSLRDLQNELMRKSMHVGSLAFAIEGQVKEKSNWFSSLRDLNRKLKILKMDQISLSEEALAYKGLVQDMDGISSTIQAKMKEQEEQYEALKLKFMQGAKERKELYNKVLELKGNIRVFCRCRPLSTEETNAGASMAVDFESAKEGELTVKANGTKKTFKFDSVFSPQADQVDVFEDTAPFAASVLDGYNACIFAYGQTGTGKTFTMEGTDEARGVNYRTLEELFRIIKEREKLIKYHVSVSVLEVYNEQIRDLLLSGCQPASAAKRLEIRQVGEGVHHVPGLVEAHVSNMNEVWEVLQSGSSARAVGATNANEHSSRSHCIHCVMVKGENLVNGECTRSKLWLVDLAGSERIAKTEVQGERLKETQNINRSLSALGDVISSLATKSPHIPFRNSKLTHLLQDSLGGDSKTLMFVQISPNENDVSETLCSLNFASRVRGIELGPAKKQLESADLLKYKQLCEKSKQDIKGKDLQIKKMEETIRTLDVKMKERDSKNKSLQDRVKDLEAQLLTERRLARQEPEAKSVDQHQHQQHLKQQAEQCTAARPPLANRPLGSYKNVSEPVNGALDDQANLYRPLKENHRGSKPFLPLPVDGFARYNDFDEKENSRDMVDQQLPPKRSGRASFCTEARRFTAPAPALAPRRSSLIPLPNAPKSAHLPPPSLVLPQLQLKNGKEDASGHEEAALLPEQKPTHSPKISKCSGKKLSSILRRSLHRQIQFNSPMQPTVRKFGVNVGMEKVRVSLGRGRVAHRVLLGTGSAKRMGARETQQKQDHKEKERGWGMGTAGRTLL